MKIQSQNPAPQTLGSRPTSKAPTELVIDQFVTSAGTAALPIGAGLAFGLPGALAGGVASFAASYALDKNVTHAATAALVPTAIAGAAVLAKNLIPGAAGLCLGLGLGVGLGLTWAAASSLKIGYPESAAPARGPVLEINEPGHTVDLEKNLVPGKTNIVCFSAPWCPGCQKIQPELKAYLDKNPNHVELHVDIKDWESDVSKQFDLKSIPHFMVYDGAGKLVSQGDEAFAQVKDLLATTAAV